MQTKEQQRSAFALKQVEQVFHIPVDEKVVSFIVGVPTLVLTNGLGQTMAFLMSKHKEPSPSDTEEKKKDKLKYKNTFDIIMNWLKLERPEDFEDAGTAFQFLNKLSSIDQT
ncbi:MAG: type III-B CRISPR module-associated protein Cmr5 [Deltaproteobacteria bacterium]|nr:type III-B CRISPR module-associated protein Cmr5 [Deltaproteobacteria bacterium]